LATLRKYGRYKYYEPFQKHCILECNSVYFDINSPVHRIDTSSIFEINRTILQREAVDKFLANFLLGCLSDPDYADNISLRIVVVPFCRNMWPYIVDGAYR
jgi:hypothetical protein